MRIASLTFAVLFALLLAPVAGPAGAEETVVFKGNYFPGTIVVKTSERRLYLVLGNGKALRYVVGVGKQGKQWSGQSRIVGKYLKPAWSATATILTEATFESWMGAPESQKSGEAFSCSSCSLTEH
jgi:lipoprotein-anchoring transpeptidase ErfK/SrfK